MVFFNESNIIGAILHNATINFTGSQDLTILICLFIFLIILSVFRMPAEVTLVMGMPFIIALAAYSSIALTVLGCIILILAGVLAKIIWD